MSEIVVGTKRIIDSVWTLRGILHDDKRMEILSFTNMDPEGYEHEGNLPRIEVIQENLPSGNRTIVAVRVQHGVNHIPYRAEEGPVYEVSNPAYIFDFMDHENARRRQEVFMETGGNAAIDDFFAKNGVWADYPDYPREDWKYEVANGDTNQGYWEWVKHQAETRAGDETSDGDRGAIDPCEPADWTPIMAYVHDDLDTVSARFDIVPALMAADDDVLRALVEDDFSPNETLDELPVMIRAKDPDLADFFTYMDIQDRLGTGKDGEGRYIVHVGDSDAAVAWVQAHRPDLFGDEPSL